MCFNSNDNKLCVVLDYALCTLAYVTYQDIRGIESFEEQTVIAIKAPPETRLEVPDPTDVSSPKCPRPDY